MNIPRLLAADPCSLLDSLLGQAFGCATAQRRHEVAESILQAMEAHAKETGDDAALDAVYLQGIQSVTTRPSASMAQNVRRCRWRFRS